jgi:hypothetical protein
LGAGHLDSADAAFREAAAIFKATGGFRFYAECEEMNSEIAYYRGDYATTLQLAGNKSWHNPDDPLALLLSAVSRAIVALRTGADTAPVALELSQLRLDTLEASDHVCVYGALARLHADPETPIYDAVRAREYAQRAFAAQGRVKMPALYSTEAHGLLADALLMLCAQSQPGDDAVLRAAEAACDALRKLTRLYPLAQARAALADARYAMLTGRSPERLLRAAAAHAARMGMPWEREQAEQALAALGERTPRVETPVVRGA